MKGNSQGKNLVVILGPTASGKTGAGVQVARALNGEIISADSRQVFRRMDIGTGKDLNEYGEVPYHLINIVDPGSEFSVFDFQKHFCRAFEEIQDRGRLPILVGGTGLYLESVLKSYRMAEVPPDPALREELSGLSLHKLAARLKASHSKLHNTTDLLDRDRVTRAIEIAEFEAKEGRNFQLPLVEPMVFGIHWPRELLRQRITKRLRERMEHGMIEEVKDLLRSGISPQSLDSYGLEYRFISRYVLGELNCNDMFQKLNSAIHQFAKRQETWFRRMERQGIDIHWVDGENEPGNKMIEIMKDKADRIASLRSQ